MSHSRQRSFWCAVIVFSTTCSEFLGCNNTIVQHGMPFINMAHLRTLNSSVDWYQLVYPHSIQQI